MIEGMCEPRLTGSVVSSEGAYVLEVSAVGQTYQSASSNGSPMIDMRVPVENLKIAQFRRALETLDLPAETVENAKLLVTELVTNSIRHAGLGPRDLVRFKAVWSEETLRVSIHDGFPRGVPPRLSGPIPPSTTGTSGWGLYLIDRLALRWGIDKKEGYWFEL